MIPLETLAKETLPGGGVVELCRRGEAKFLTVDRQGVRSSETSRLEESAVIAVCEPLAVKRQPRVLLEGIGLGQALRKALQVLPPRGHVTVAEPIEALGVWQRRFFPPLNPKNPDHVHVLPHSLAQCLMAQPEHFDAILLEVDYALGALLEGGLRRPSRYRDALQQLKRALRPRGQLAIRCQEKEPSLVKALQAEGFLVETRTGSPHKRSKSNRHPLILARLPLPGSR